MKDGRYTYCSRNGRGPHATVYAVKSGDVTESVLSRPTACQRCVSGFKRHLALSPVLREIVARRTRAEEKS